MAMNLDRQIRGRLNERPTRRGFFRAAGRAVVLAGFAIFGVGQEWKRRRLEADPRCVKVSPCIACGEFGWCAKPKAQGARSVCASTSSRST